MSGQVHWSDRIEEAVMALLLGAMTLLTFANVIARYFFSSNILWALELTVFLFAWMVLLGASYGIKNSMHIGVDVVVNVLPDPWRWWAALAAFASCALFALLMLVGSWEYWYGFLSKYSFLETEDIPMPSVLQFLAAWLNDGEPYEKVPRYIPYAVLPLSMALLLLRVLQAGAGILRGEAHFMIGHHAAGSEEVERQ